MKIAAVSVTTAVKSESDIFMHGWFCVEKGDTILENDHTCLDHFL